MMNFDMALKNSGALAESHSLELPFEAFNLFTMRSFWELRR
jgi:hypothetical protein